MRQFGVFIVVVAAVALAAGAYAQDKPANPKAGEEMQGQMGGMMSEDRDMMAMRQEMMADMNAAAAKLDGLVAMMNAVDGVKKVDAMASVITELVAQQKTMRHRMMSMQPGMLQHMMAHMNAGTMDGMQKSMSMCPMMKEAGDSGAGEVKEGQSDHEKHHPESKE